MFAILEGAAMQDLPAVLRCYEPDHRCLYRGVLAPDMAQVAPYLVALQRNAPFTEWLLSNGWGMNWGVFGVSRADLSSLCRHFRRFVRIDYGGKSVFFRYYSPSVMRNYLPLCTLDDLRFVFGPAGLFLVEDEDPRVASVFTLKESALHRNDMLLHEMEGPFAEGPFDENQVASSRPFLTIEHGQLKKLGMSIYVGRIRDFLHEVFAESVEIPREVLGEMIEELTERAAGYKLVLETHVVPFIFAAWVLGWNFDEEYPAAKKVLEDYEMDCGLKAEWLFEYVQAVAVSIKGPYDRAGQTWTDKGTS